MKKVLLIAFYFNQKNEIASKRLRGLAKYLPRFGWDPIVLVPKLSDDSNINYTDNFTIYETDYEDMLDKWMNKFKINNNPFKPLNSNYSSEFKDIKSKNKEFKDSVNNNWDKQDIKGKNNNKLLSKCISLAGELFAYPDGMKYWYNPVIDVSSGIIEDNNIKGIISSSWPVTSHIIAKDLKKQFKIPWIADLRDLWNMNPYVSHNFIRSYFEKKLEINTFKYADILTTTTKLAALNLKKLHPNNKIYPVLSGFDPEDFLDIENDHSSNGISLISSNINENDNIDYNNNNNCDNKFNILNFTYTGSLYGGKRDPTLLFKGIRQLIDENKIDPTKIALDFYGDNNNLEKIANEYGISNLLNIHGSVPHSEALIKQKESQVLLLISWNNKKEEMFIPGKIYEYFASKRPVLSIGYKNGSLKDLIEKTNVGYHVSNINETKIALMNIYNKFTENGKVNYNGNNEVNSYSMVNTAKKFGKILDSIAID